MKANNLEILNFQLRSIIVVKYFENYKLLEDEIKKIFKLNLSKMDEQFKNKLYFLYGGKINVNIDYATSSLMMLSRKYKVEESFNEFSINQILRICREDKKINEFNFLIDSMQRKNVQFEFYDSSIKLMNMRNKLAHEILEERFQEKDVIELLTDTKIKENIIESIENLDITLMDETTKQIYSNLLYLNKILLKLNSEIVLQ